MYFSRVSHLAGAPDNSSDVVGEKGRVAGQHVSNDARMPRVNPCRVSVPEVVPGRGTTLWEPPGLVRPGARIVRYTGKKNRDQEPARAGTRVGRFPFPF